MLRGVAKRSDIILRCSGPKLPKKKEDLFYFEFVYREYFEGTLRDDEDHIDDVALFLRMSKYFFSSLCFHYLP